MFLLTREIKAQEPSPPPPPHHHLLPPPSSPGGPKSTRRSSLLHAADHRAKCHRIKRNGQPPVNHQTRGTVKLSGSRPPPSQHSGGTASGIPRAPNHGILLQSNHRITLPHPPGNSHPSLIDWVDVFIQNNLTKMEL